MDFNIVTDRVISIIKRMKIGLKIKGYWLSNYYINLICCTDDILMIESEYDQQWLLCKFSMKKNKKI